MDTGIELFVVYENPKDYPGQFVVRRWVITAQHDAPVADKEPMIVSDNIGYVRGVLKSCDGHCIGREQDDDACILEVWV